MYKIPAKNPSVLPNISFAKGVYETIEGKDALVVVTEWPEFSQIDLKKAKKLMRRPIIVDGRNIFDSKRVKELGFKYVGIGQ